MPPRRQLVSRIAVALLLTVIAAACSVFGPDLHISIDNGGPKEVTVIVDSSGSGMTGGPDVTVLPRNTGVEWSEPLRSTWEIKVDGKHIIGSGDRTDLALPSSGQRQDLTITIQIAKDGTVMLLDTH